MVDNLQEFWKLLPNDIQTICLDLLDPDTPFYMPESLEGGLFGAVAKWIAIYF